MTASVQQLSERLRAEIGDTARAFTDSFTVMVLRLGFNLQPTLFRDTHLLSK